MDQVTLIFLLRGGHLRMPERLDRGLWPHPPLVLNDLVALVAESLKNEEWFPHRWEATKPGQVTREGGTLQRIGPTRFVYRSQRSTPTNPFVVAESGETLIASAE